MNDLWATFLAGIALVAAGIRAFPDGAVYKGVKIPGWAQFILLFLGLILTCMSLWGLYRRRGKLRTFEYSEEEIARAKLSLEKAYFKEHGTLPDYPDEKKENSPGDAEDKKET